MIPDSAIWLTILFLGLGTNLIRLSFIGLLGGRRLPDWAMRHLRYVPIAVMPGFAAPLILFPAATGGQPDPARLIAAAVALLVGISTRSTLWAVLAGMVTLYLGLAIF